MLDRCMKRNGMYIGSHGFNHYWLDTLSKEQQYREIDLSLEFMKSIECSIENFVFTYPYGSYNETLISVLKERGCGLALATQVGIADLSMNPFTLQRLDTNDLPKDSMAMPNRWTLEVVS